MSKLKPIQLTHSILVALILVSSAAVAENYPAANFQPKVIYSSEEVVKAQPSTPCPPNTQQAEVDSKYPAASFQPKVIYSNPEFKQGS